MKDVNTISEYFKKLDFPISVLETENQNQSDYTVIINGEKVVVEIKSEVRPEHAVKWSQPNKTSQLVMAEYITPAAKEILKTNSINYIDSFGNAFIYLKNLKLFIEKGDARPTSREYPSVFTPTGARILFHLLSEKNAINYNYRELAYASGVALGSVSKVINALHNEGYVIKLDQKRLQLVRRKELLDRWIILLNEKLLPAHKAGTFAFSRLASSEAWRDIALDKGTLWGGEAGASLLTNYLNPDDFSLFSTTQKGELIHQLRIVPDNNGVITLYRPFWTPTENLRQNQQTVHPLIIYGQLIYSGYSRNLETAQLIYDKYLRDEF
jgi:hypothetical protein